jgi:hypothetical protein
MSTLVAPTATVNANLQASFAKLGDNSWGVKLYGSLVTSALGQAGKQVFVTKRNGGGTHVTLGEYLHQANGGRSAWYRIARDPSRPQQAQAEPKRELDYTVHVTQPGVYENEDGIFIVKPTRDKSRLYAKKLVEINAERATEAGERVQIEFEYAKGAIYKLKPEHKMDLERAKALTIRYGRCIVCNTPLKAAESVERGIGPVCIKSFR